MPAPARYSGAAIALHWLVAAAVLATFPLGLYLADLPISPRRLALVSYHQWIGVTVFALMVVRLAWRLTHRPPPPPPGTPVWQWRTATLAHWMIYALLIAIPLSGWLHSSAGGMTIAYLGRWPLPDAVGEDAALADAMKLAHKSLNFTLLALVVVHVAAAIKHHFVDRDGLLARMWPWPARANYFGSSGNGGIERR